MDAWQRISGSLIEDGDGDREAVARAIYRSHAGDVHRYLKTYGFMEADCQDLTQVTFVRAFCKLEEFRCEASLRTWLLSIAKNSALNFLRERHALKRSAETQPLEPPPTDSGAVHRGVACLGPDPLEEVLIEERYRLVRDALCELPRSLRRVVLLRLVHDLKYREIAGVLQVPIGTVRSRLSKARLVLRRSLGDDQGWRELEEDA